MTWYAVSCILGFQFCSGGGPPDTHTSGTHGNIANLLQSLRAKNCVMCVMMIQIIVIYLLSVCDCQILKKYDFLICGLLFVDCDLD